MIEPHGLMLGHRSHSWRGKSRAAKTILNFRMDRIHGAVVLDELCLGTGLHAE